MKAGIISNYFSIIVRLGITTRSTSDSDVCSILNPSPEKGKNAFRPALKAHQNFKFQNVLRIKADPLNIHHRRTQVFNLLM